MGEPGFGRDRKRCLQRDLGVHSRERRCCRGTRGVLKPGGLDDPGVGFHKGIFARRAGLGPGEEALAGS